MSTKIFACIALLLVVTVTSGINIVSGLNDNPPTSIQDVHTDLQGPNNFVISFTLRDNNMTDTISDGSVTVEIIQTPYISFKGSPTVIFNQTREVKKADFKESSLGALYYSLGPISSSQFSHLNINGANYTVVNIYFITLSGQVLSSQCDLPIPL